MEGQGRAEPSAGNRIEDLLNARAESYVKPNAPAGPVVDAQVVRRQEEPPARVQAPEPVVNREVKKGSYSRILRRVFYVVTALVLIPLVAFGGYKVFKNFESSKNTASGVLEAVGKLVSLPQDEEPTVATITDLAPLEGQQFFKDAHIGDKVIVYKKAGKAILYRPSQNKIITAAPLTQ